MSVNINKIATLRNSRGGQIPDVLLAARRDQEFGAEGITVHPRPDERHIRYADARALRSVVHIEYNIEGYPSRDFIDLVLDCAPEQVTLVPDGPDVLTSNAGWDTLAHAGMLREVVAEFRAAGIRTSLFIECDATLIEGARAVGADRIELYTEAYAKATMRPWRCAPRAIPPVLSGFARLWWLRTRNLQHLPRRSAWVSTRATTSVLRTSLFLPHHCPSSTRCRLVTP